MEAARRLVTAEKGKKLSIRQASLERFRISGLLERDCLGGQRLAVYRRLVALKRRAPRHKLLLPSCYEAELTVHGLVKVADKIMELLHTEQRRDRGRGRAGGRGG